MKSDVKCKFNSCEEESTGPWATHALSLAVMMLVRLWQKVGGWKRMRERQGRGHTSTGLICNTVTIFRKNEELVGMYLQGQADYNDRVIPVTARDE